MSYLEAAQVAERYLATDEIVGIMAYASTNHAAVQVVAEAFHKLPGNAYQPLKASGLVYKDVDGVRFSTIQK